jgi:hypothetical protein
MRAIALPLAALLYVAVPTHAIAQAITGVKFDSEMCRFVSTMVDSSGNELTECKRACAATVIDATFVANAKACHAKVHENPRDPAQIGEGPGVALPWVAIVTDFFVARLKGEAALFLKERVADQVCPKDSNAVTYALMPKTCGVLHGTDGGISALPAAFRTDVEVLPERAFAYAITLAGKTLPSEARDTICVGAVLPGPIRALRQKGPYAALKKLKQSVAPHPDCAKSVQQTRDAASWVLAVLESLEGKKASIVSVAQIETEVHTASMSLLSGRVPVLAAEIAGANDLENAVEALGDRWKQVEPLITELVVLVRQIDAGERDPAVIDRAAELTVLITVRLLDFDDATKADLAAAAQAIAAFATKRYLDGALAVFSIAKLDAYLGKNDTTKKVWNNLGHWASVLGALADAKSAEDAQAVLDAAAAPLGSYREFTQGGWKGFISGWAGVGGGRDVIFEENGRSNATAVGPMFPVGFEFGHPVYGSTSIQVLLSVIDIGTVAIARFDDDADGGTEGDDGDLRESPDVGFASIFAPGVFVGVRPGRLPFVIGGGAEFLPKTVVKFDCDTGVTTCEETTAVPTVRFMAFLSFDVTAFRIF